MNKAAAMKGWVGLMILAAGSGMLQAAEKKATKSPAKAPQAEIYVVDATASEVRWLGKKVTGQHDGTIAIKSGEIRVAQGKPSDGTVVIDMNSLTVLDIKDPGTNAKLAGHLKSDDFFGVDKHPTSVYKITGFSPIEGAKAGEPNYRAKGELTVKGATHPLEIPVSVSIDGGTAKATASGVKIDRTLYDVRYGSGKFFQNLGDKMIEDTFTLDFTVSARKK